MPPAGLADPANDESAERTLKAEGLPAPPTPDHMAKWRKNYTPGATIIHPGIADDTAHKKLEIYGRSEPVGVKVVRCLAIPLDVAATPAPPAAVRRSKYLPRRTRSLRPDVMSINPALASPTSAKEVGVSSRISYTESESPRTGDVV